jgi:hypothetical protein
MDDAQWRDHRWQSEGDDWAAFDPCRPAPDAPPRTAYQDRLARDGFTFRPTTDDWAPTFPDGTVAISSPTTWPDGRSGITVMGGDDDILSCAYASRDAAEAAWSGLPAIITKSDLAERGFR